MYIPTDMHEYLSKTAEKRHDTITRLVLRALFRYIEWEKKQD